MLVTKTILLFASLGSKVQLAPPMVNICGKNNGCANFKIGYFLLTICQIQNIF